MVAAFHLDFGRNGKDVHFLQIIIIKTGDYKLTKLMTNLNLVKDYIVVPEGKSDAHRRQARVLKLPLP